MLTPGAVFLLLVVFYVLSSIKILAEYERGVIFRLGKLLAQPKGPGVVLVFAPIDRMVRMSLRTVVHDVPPQDVITRDNVSVKVNAVVYYRVIDPRRAVVEVKHVDLPPEMQRAMAKQAEAEREKRAKIIHASGEYEAATQLVMAAD